VRAFRLQRDWTQKELADRAGIAPSNIAFIEGGLRKALSRTFCSLPPAFACEPWILLRPQPAAPCATCGDTPPVGFMCLVCRTPGPAPA
jgi:transcriptional regulator with XRE-family HTH domain